MLEPGTFRTYADGKAVFYAESTRRRRPARQHLHAAARGRSRRGRDRRLGGAARAAGRPHADGRAARRRAHRRRAGAGQFPPHPLRRARHTGRGAGGGQRPARARSGSARAGPARFHRTLGRRRTAAAHLDAADGAGARAHRRAARRRCARAKAAMRGSRSRSCSISSIRTSCRRRRSGSRRGGCRRRSAPGGCMRCSPALGLWLLHRQSPASGWIRREGGGMNLLDRYLARTILVHTLMVMGVLLALMTLVTFLGQQDDIGQGSYDVTAAFLVTLPAAAAAGLRTAADRRADRRDHRPRRPRARQRAHDRARGRRVGRAHRALRRIRGRHRRGARCG